jgi:ribose transport system substrate-binding protein
MRKYLGLAVAGLAVAFAGHAAAAEKLKIGFLPGVVDPFYQVMQLGVEKAAKDLGVEVVTQIPPTWGVAAQTPLLDSMIARGDLNYIITAATDKDQMIGPLKAPWTLASKSSSSTVTLATATT